MATHTLIHVLHDVGAATWFGGSLMGATGLNAAAASLDDPTQRAAASTAGWSRWAPVGGAAVLAHVIGAAGLARTEAPRVSAQQGARRSTAVKTALTAAGLGVSGWSLLLNRKMAAAGPVPVEGATEPMATTPDEVAAVQRQLKLVQWLNPLLAGAIVGVASWQEEQKRASQSVPGVLKGLPSAVPGGLPLVAAAGATLLGVKALRSRRRRQPVEVYPQPVVRRPLPQDQAYGDPVTRVTAGSVEQDPQQQ